MPILPTALFPCRFPSVTKGRGGEIAERTVLLERQKEGIAIAKAKELGTVQRFKIENRVVIGANDRRSVKLQNSGS